MAISAAQHQAKVNELEVANRERLQEQRKTYDNIITSEKNTNTMKVETRTENSENLKNKIIAAYETRLDLSQEKLKQAIAHSEKEKEDSIKTQKNLFQKERTQMKRDFAYQIRKLEKSFQSVVEGQHATLRDTIKQYNRKLDAKDVRNDEEKKEVIASLNTKLENVKNSYNKQIKEMGRQKILND